MAPKQTATAARETRPATSRSDPPPPTARVAELLERRRLIVALIAVAAVPRLWTALSFHGIVWPDEIYQATESAHRVAFGYGFTPWEFEEGARSYLFPGVIAVVWKVCGLVRFDDGLSLMRAAKLVMVAFSILGMALAVDYARRLGGAGAAVITAGLTLAYPLCLLYGSRTFSEAAAVPLVLATVAVTVPERARTHVAVLAGAAGGAAMTLRPQNVIVVAIVATGLLATRRPGTASRYAAGAGAGFTLGGLLDWLTWGAPFSSTWRILEFNLFDEAHTEYGSQSVGFYVRNLTTSSGPVFLFVLIGLVAAARKAPIGVSVVLGYVLVHSLLPHKELRYLYPVVPLALALAGIGIALTIHRLVTSVRAQPGQRSAQAWASIATAGAAVGFSLAWLPTMTFDRIGEQDRGITQTQASVWNYSQGFNRMLSHAGQQPETCGVAILSRIPDHSIIFLGGYSYLHRDVPLFNVYADEMTAGNPNLAGANVLLSQAGEKVPPEFRPVELSHGVQMYVRNGPCGAPPVGYTTHFPK